MWAIDIWAIICNAISQETFFQNNSSDIVPLHGRKELVNNSVQLLAGETQGLYAIALSNVLEESNDRFFTAVVEDVTRSLAPAYFKAFEMSAVLDEMTQPAELLATAWMIVVQPYKA